MTVSSVQISLRVNKEMPGFGSGGGLVLIHFSGPECPTQCIRRYRKVIGRDRSREFMEK